MTRFAVFLFGITSGPLLNQHLWDRLNFSSLLDYQGSGRRRISILSIMADAYFSNHGALNRSSNELKARHFSESTFQSALVWRP